MSIMELDFHCWAFLFVLSIINLISLTEDFKDIENMSEEKWMLSVAILSIIVALIALLRRLFVETTELITNIEKLMVLFVVSIWCAGLPFLMDGGGLMLSGGSLNTFFSSWGAFIVVIMLLSSRIQELMGKADHKTWYHWSGFSVSAIVVLWTCVRYWKDHCDSTDTISCGSTMFGLVLGVISFFVGLVMLQTDGQFELFGSMVMFVAWGVAVGFLTYGEGPGTMFGTLYFSTWVAFFLVLRVVSFTVHDMVIKKEETDETPPAVNKDIVEENKDHISNDEVEEVDTNEA